MGKGMGALWIMFALFVSVFAAGLAVRLPIDPTSAMWLALNLWAVALSALLLHKRGLPCKKGVGLSAGLAALAAAGNGAVHPNAFSILLSFAVTLLAALAVLGAGVALVQRRALASVLFGLALGVPLGALNCLLMAQGAPAQFHFSLSRLVAVLNPAIMEELAFRALFLAYCLSAAGDRLDTGKARFTCHFMMVVPHALAHTPQSFIDGGPISGLATTALLALLFGLPFALLQRKRDIVSAMVGHGMVDFIRFCFFGVPG